MDKKENFVKDIEEYLELFGEGLEINPNYIRLANYLLRFGPTEIVDGEDFIRLDLTIDEKDYKFVIYKRNDKLFKLYIDSTKLKGEFNCNTVEELDTLLKVAQLV